MEYPITSTVVYDSNHPAPGESEYLGDHRTETVREYRDRSEITFKRDYYAHDDRDPDAPELCHELEITRIVFKEPGKDTRLYLDGEFFGRWEQGKDHEGLSDYAHSIMEFGVDQAIRGRYDVVLFAIIEDVDSDGTEMSVEVYWKPDFVEQNHGEIIGFYGDEDDPPITIKGLSGGEIVWKTYQHSHGAHVVDFCEVDSMDELERGCFYIANTEVRSPEDGEDE